MGRKMIVIPGEKIRKILKVVIPGLLIPVLILFAYFSTRLKNYTVITLVLLFLSLILFMCSYEKKRIGSRRLVLASVMTALAVTGRFIPVLKPMAAIVVITGIYLGSETGFLVGALTAVISNFYFGQGPWTPFQMFALGSIGFMAGVLNKPLKQNRIILVFYGVVTGILYSMIMDIWTVLWYGEGFQFTLYLASQAAALPFTISYAVSNALFLWFMIRPFGDKLERIGIKYGI